jgi:hypothetical protein
MTAAHDHFHRRGLVARTCLLAAFAAGPGVARAQTPTETVNVTVGNSSGPEGAAPWGSVTSSPAGIDCPADCTEAFAAGTQITLRVKSTLPGYELAAWEPLPSDPACAETPTCTLTLDPNDGIEPQVRATFRPAAQLLAVAAGSGSIRISAPQLEADCDNGEQQDGCLQRFPTGTRVTLRANPTGGASFVGWSDNRCPGRNTTCRVTMVAGDQYVTARFSLVRLTILGDAFGTITMTPQSGVPCTMMPDTPTCVVYRTGSSGTNVTLRREHGAPGLFWVGPCQGNMEGLLNAPTCRLVLQGDETVGAGYDSIGAIPPPLGSGIRVEVAGKGRGKVTGRVLTGGNERLNCGRSCTITGLTRNDVVQLTAVGRSGARVRWSDGSRARVRILQVSAVNRIKATFIRR